MTTKEFSEGFDTLVSSYMRFKDFDNKEIMDSIEFDEYEKSVFLTKAQKEIVISLYSGKNQYGDSFERTEEMRRYLDPLVRTMVQTDTVDGESVNENSVFYVLPEDIAYITLEQVIISEPNSCWDGKRINVRPVRQDEYDRIKDNPFRGVTDNRVLRLDAGIGTVELISKHNIGSYLVRYVSRPEPIVLEDLPNGLSVEGYSNEQPCLLDQMLHQQILERAVVLALNSKRIYTNNNN